jgi:hypothetical protein
MNIEQAYAAIQDFVKCQQNLFVDTCIELAFGSDRAPIGYWSDNENIGILNIGDGIGNKSGIYFFALPNGEIVYIGKAGQNNLHQRVWDHLKTPQELGHDKKRFFPKHKFLNELPSYADEFTKGSIKLVVSSSKTFTY